MVVVCSVLLGSVVPAPAGAQELDVPESYGERLAEPSVTRGAEALPAGDASVSTDEAATEGAELEVSGDTSEPWRLELIAGVAPSFGMGLFNTVQSLEWTPIFAEMGIPLGSRALLMVGATGSFSSSPSGSWAQVTVPLGILAYLDRPRAGAFVPTVRAGVFGSVWAADGFEPSFGWGALARAGLTWLPVEQVGIRGELGPRLSVAQSSEHASVSLGIDLLLGIVVRV